jgi:hypothetical protein
MERFLSLIEHYGHLLIFFRVILPIHYNTFPPIR